MNFFANIFVRSSVFLFVVASAYAGTAVVEVLGNNTFSPRDITIQAGDTVRWEWVGGSHTVTSGTGATAPDAGSLFDEASSRDNPEYSYTFTDAGEFPYFCRPHEFFDMRGSVTVLAAGERSILAVVQLENGDPVNCATVIARAGTIEETAVVDSAGMAGFDGLSDSVASFALEVSAPEFALTTGPATVSDADFDANGMAGVTLVVAPTNTTLQQVVRGTVTDVRNNAALPGVRVETLIDGMPVDPENVGYSCRTGVYEVDRFTAKGGGEVTLEFRAANFETLVVNPSPIGESLNVAMTPTGNFDGDMGCAAMMMHQHWASRPVWSNWALIAVAGGLLVVIGRAFGSRRAESSPAPVTGR